MFAAGFNKVYRSPGYVMTVKSKDYSDRVKK